MESLTVLQALAILAALTGIVVGTSVYYLRKSTDRMDDRINQTIDNVEHSNNNLYNILKDNHNEIKKEIKDLYIHIDERIDRMHNRLDSNSNELKEFITNEVTQLKAKDYDQDIKIDQAKEKITSVSEDLLKYKIEAMEKYEKKRDS